MKLASRLAVLGAFLSAGMALQIPAHAVSTPVGKAPAKTTPAGPYTGVPGDQPLAKVGDVYIRAVDLERALASSPLSTAFVSMNKDAQARVRGDMLRRLIAAQLLRLEALDQGVDKSPTYVAELSAFRASLLSQAYLRHIRDGIKVPPKLDEDLRKRLRGDADALTAARSAYVGRQYPAARAKALRDALKKYKVQAWPERIVQGATKDTLLASGTGISLRLGDLNGGLDASQALDRLAQIKRRLNESIEILVMARAAMDAGINVEAVVTRYGGDLLARLLLRGKQSQWIPSEDAKRAWYKANPKVGNVPTRLHLGQIVLADERTAKSVRKRILAGESLFTLAGRMSVDPLGRKHSGDMGWVRQGSGRPELEKAIAGLKDGEISRIVKTGKGYHILTILERKPGQQKTYAEVHDRVQQAMVAAQLPNYLLTLRKKHKVKLNPDDQR